MEASTADSERRVRATGGRCGEREAEHSHAGKGANDGECRAAGGMKVARHVAGTGHEEHKHGVASA